MDINNIVNISVDAKDIEKVDIISLAIFLNNMVNQSVFTIEASETTHENSTINVIGTYTQREAVFALINFLNNKLMTGEVEFKHNSSNNFSTLIATEGNNVFKLVFKV